MQANRKGAVLVLFFCGLGTVFSTAQQGKTASTSAAIKATSAPQNLPLLGAEEGLSVIAAALDRDYARAKPTARIWCTTFMNAPDLLIHMCLPPISMQGARNSSA